MPPRTSTKTLTGKLERPNHGFERRCVTQGGHIGVNWILTQPDEPPSSNQISFSFPEFESTNGTIKSYAVIVTTGENVAGQVPSRGILNKTYDDFKNNKTNTYVSNIKEMASRTLRSLTANSVTVKIGAGDKQYGYYNGPLEPSTSYWISVAGFTDIEFDNATGTILEDRSVATFSPFSNEIKTSVNSTQNTSQNSEPKTVKLLRDNAKTSSSVSLIWDQPDEYQAEFRYRIQTANASSAMINEIIVTNQTVNVTNLTPGETYTFTVFTRAADNVTESYSVSYTTCTGVNWILTQPDEPPSSNQISFSFPEFESTNEPIKSYAVIVTTGENVAGQVPSRGILNKTYDDFKNNKTNTYVSNIKEMASRTLRSLTANSVTVKIGAGDKQYGYYNGPLEPSTSYWY
ncbi:receptor-type tyrosine-protein phosphatase eta-like [Pelobates fuscus]|uniref:receptor-type tyrosine-protein phosphatase eta-like n=1 Tax=Pelobates fuscus TaxID=191477 RepID=UPI002FE44398